MADTKISALSALTTRDTLDELVVVDKSDTTMAASGTDKRVTVGTLDGWISSGPYPGDWVAPYDPILVTAGSAVAGNNQGRACLVVVPKTGSLRDLYVYVAASSGNVEGAVYSSASTRAKLWSSGSIACPAANGWGSLGDPNLSVTKGDFLYLVIAADNTTATFGRHTSLGVAALNTMPGSFWAGGGGTPKRATTIASFTPGSAPPNISEANMVAATTVPMLMARIT